MTATPIMGTQAVAQSQAAGNLMDSASVFSREQIDLIKESVCKGATDLEFRLFIADCNHRGLNPLARQIYSIQRREKRGDQWVTTRSTQVSIDGFRLIAERSGQYAGQLIPEYCGADGQWRDVWLDSSEPPAAARVAVLRKDFEKPCWGVARFDAYVQRKDGKPIRMWATMPDVMLSKCAEALALRKAFPQELSGLYTSDEMMQATSEAGPKSQHAPYEELDDEIPETDERPTTDPAEDLLFTMAREAEQRGMLKKFYDGQSPDAQVKLLPQVAPKIAARGKAALDDFFNKQSNKPQAWLREHMAELVALCPR